MVIPGSIAVRRFWLVRCPEGLRRTFALVAAGALGLIALSNPLGGSGLLSLSLSIMVGVHGVALLLRAVLPPRFLDVIATFDSIARINQIDRKKNPSRAALELERYHILKLTLIGERAVPQVIEELRDPSAMAPGAPFPMVLNRIGEVAVPYLRRAIRHKDGNVRRHSIRILGQIGGDDAAQALREVESEPFLAEDVRLALGQIKLSESRHHGR